MADSKEWLKSMMDAAERLKDARKQDVRDCSRDSVEPLQLDFIEEWKAHQGRVTSISTHSTDQHKFLSGGYDKNVFLWTTKLGSKPVSRLVTKHSGNVSSVLLITDDEVDFLISSSWSGGISIFEEKDSRFVARRVFNTKSPVAKLIMSHDHRVLFPLDQFKPTFRMYNTLGELKYTFTNPDEEKLSAHARTKNEIFVAGWESYKIQRVPLNTLKPESSAVSPSSPVVHMCISPDDTLLLVLCSDGSVVLYEVVNLNYLDGIQLHQRAFDISVSPTHYSFAVACEDGVVVVDLEEPKRVYWSPRKDKKTEYSCVAWGHDGYFLYAGCANGNITKWKVPRD